MVTLQETITSNTVFSAEGELRLRLISGRMTVIGKEFRSGETLHLAGGRQLPVEVAAGSRLEIQAGSGGSWQRREKRTIPRAWDGLAKAVAAGRCRTVLILGETDTGKTFLATYLMNRLLAAGKKAGILDADTGQSVIGPPATIGFARCTRQTVFLDDLKPSFLYFTGAYSPGTDLLRFASGLAAASAFAHKRGGTVVVNTPGWVQGEGGRRLVESETAILAPDLIVLLERNGELRYLARRCRKVVHALPVPDAVRKRSAIERREARQRTAQRYFRNARSFELSFDTVATDRCFLFSGRRITLPAMAPVLWAERLGEKEGVLLVCRRHLTETEMETLASRFGTSNLRIIRAGDEQNLEVALCDGQGSVLSLGILVRIRFDTRRCRVLAPLSPRLQKRVRIIQFGNVKILPDGTETGTLLPGYL